MDHNVCMVDGNHNNVHGTIIKLLVSFYYLFLKVLFGSLVGGLAVAKGQKPQ